MACICGKNTTPGFKDKKKLEYVEYVWEFVNGPARLIGLGDTTGIVAAVRGMTIAANFDPISGGPELRSYLHHNYLLVESMNIQISGNYFANDLNTQLREPLNVAGATIFGDDARETVEINKYRTNSQYEPSRQIVKYPFYLTANTMFFTTHINATAGLKTYSIVFKIKETGCYCELPGTELPFPDPKRKLNLIG